MRCGEARAAYLEGDRSEQVTAHLATCPACREVGAPIESMASLLDDVALWEEPAPGGWERTVRLMAGAVPEGPRPPALKLAAVAIAAVVLAIVGFLALTTARAPDWEFDLVAVDSPGQASIAGWNTEAGSRMVLTVEDLPPARDGFYYEVWLSDGPRHISAGSFSGPGSVDLWVGVRRSEFPRVWISLEPADGVPGIDGATVFDTSGFDS